MNKNFLILFFGILFISLISASVSVGNPSYSIDKTYQPGDSLRGWINLSLNSESGETILSDANGNSISLLDLLKNSSTDYSCDPVDCKKDYSASNPQTAKTIDLQKNQFKIVGMKIIGDLSDYGVNSVKLLFESDAPADCKNQINIDFFDDGINDIENSNVSALACTSTKNWGCYNPSKTLTDAKLGQIPYCQKVFLETAPGYEIGARLKRVGAAKPVVMSLFQINNSELIASCNLADKIGPSDKEEFCVVNYPLSRGNYYACVQSETEDIEYFIKGYQDSSGCGFHDSPGNQNNLSYSYSIFVQSKKYDSVGKINISREGLDYLITGEEYNNYIKEKYGSLDCSSGCLVPIKIIANADQKITLKDFKVSYDTVGFGEKTDSNLYDFTQTPIGITSEFQKISIDNAGFFVSDSVGTEDVSVSIGGAQVFSDQINIKEVASPNSLNPLSAPAAVPTEFFVSSSQSAENIISYLWDFGDGKTETTTTNSVTHTYDKIGNVNLKITLVSSSQEKGSKIFNVTILSPEMFINSTISEKIQNLEKIKTDIKSFSKFEQDSINNQLGVSYMGDRIADIQKIYMQSGNSNQTYVQLMEKLIDLKIPEKILVTKSSEDLLFYPSSDAVDYNIFKQVDDSGIDLENTDDFSGLVSNWYKKNIETRVNYKEISGKYSGDTQLILSSFELKISEKNNLDYSPIFFMKQLDNLKFSGDFESTNISDYIYFPIKQKSTMITFTTSEKIDFTSLPVFISPSLSEIGIQEKPEPKNNSLTWIIFGIVFLILAGLTIFVYLKLQKWYEKNYEAHLFPNKNQLYNLATFIANAKKNNKSDSEIINNLKKAGWSGEQVKYAVKKYLGKKTGMVELPGFEKKSATSRRYPLRK